MKNKSLGIRIRMTLVFILCCVFAIIIPITYISTTNTINKLTSTLLEFNLKNVLKIVTERYKRIDDIGASDDKNAVLKFQTQLFSQIKALSSENTGLFYILDTNGRVLLHDSIENGHIFLEDQALLTKLLSGQMTLLNYKSQGAQMSSLCTLFEGWNWVICAELKDSILYKDRADFIYNLVLTFLIIFIASLFMILIFDKGITKTTSTLLQKLESIFMMIHDISKGNSEIASISEKQSLELLNISKTLKEISQSLFDATKNSKEASTLVRDTVTYVKEGSDSSFKTEDAMKRISEGGKKISEIIKIVEDMAFQTNILAINAAIEAAKAGDQGKGFAVVAVEVRELSQKSTKSTQEIKLLINDSLKRVSEGDILVKENAKNLKNVTEKITKMANIVDELIQVTREQSKSIAHIDGQIDNIATSTSASTKLIATISSLSKTLSKDTSTLGNSIKKYFSGIS